MGRGAVRQRPSHRYSLVLSHVYRLMGGAGRKRKVDVAEMPEATMQSANYTAALRNENVSWPRVTCVLLYPNGTAQEVRLDSSPEKIRPEYEAVLGGDAKIVGQGESLMVLSLANGNDQPYNQHQPLPFVAVQSIQGPVLYIGMESNGTELRNYSMLEHAMLLETVQRSSRGLSSAQDVHMEPDEVDSNDGMGFEEYYSSDPDEDDLYAYRRGDGDYDEDYDEDYDDDDDELYDDYDDEYEDDESLVTGGSRPGLVEERIEKEFQAKYGRSPTELELAEAMQKVRLEEKKADRVPSPGRAMKRDKIVEEPEYVSSYYSEEYSDDEEYDGSRDSAEDNDQEDYDDEIDARDDEDEDADFVEEDDNDSEEYNLDSPEDESANDGEVVYDDGYDEESEDDEESYYTNSDSY